MSCVVPAPGVNVDGDDRWLCLHKLFLAEGTEKEPDVVVLGDYTVAFLQQSEASFLNRRIFACVCRREIHILSRELKCLFFYLKVWENYFAPLHCLNFGIPEDRIENVLWRIENGELDNVKAKVVVLSVGSNDNASSPEAVSEGIVTCTTAIKSRLPEAQIVVLKLLPCGQHPNSQRDRRRQINELLAKALKGQPQVQLVDLDPGLVRPDGTIGYHDMFDFLHLSRQGFVSTFEPLADLVAQLLREAAGAGDTPVAAS
ncbi:platelet-activating factor acetylhydrolase IB subunit beta homolog isoform X1 [Dermacentor silvarum]|uniref:platelet-activating factor acetylhydrolase IB subunit beta homolog isoform X1 n=1 Tax=Dermacentor silvarum TaxID=543639 RepID=UPI0021009DA6|nr:platelet-activating factor acetylhydrolase IB subunit beta homolog isoform X1 [Dermacentor silvarum]